MNSDRSFLDEFEDRLDTIDLSNKISYIEFLKINDQVWDSIYPNSSQTFYTWKDAYDRWMQKFGYDDHSLEENLWTYGKTMNLETKAEYINRGSYGCGISPPVCGPNKGDPNSFMKVMKTSLANEEKVITQRLEKIKGHEKWALFASNQCKINKRDRLLLPNKCAMTEEKDISGLTMEKAQMMQDWIAKMNKISNVYTRSIEAATFLIHLAQDITSMHECLDRRGKSNGFVHLDLKLDNVAVSLQDGLPRLIDFGFAREIQGAEMKNMPGHDAYMYWPPDFNIAMLSQFQPNSPVLSEDIYDMMGRHYGPVLSSEAQTRLSQFITNWEYITFNVAELPLVDIFSYGLLAFVLLKQLNISPKNTTFEHALYQTIHPNTLHRPKTLRNVIDGLRKYARDQGKLDPNSVEKKKAEKIILEKLDKFMKTHRSFEMKRTWLYLATSDWQLTPDQNRRIERKLFLPQELAIEEIVGTANLKLIQQIRKEWKTNQYENLSVDEMWKRLPVFELGYLTAAGFILERKSLWTEQEKQAFKNEVLTYTMQLIQAVISKMTKEQKETLLRRITRKAFFVNDNQTDDGLDAIKNVLKSS